MRPIVDQAIKQARGRPWGKPAQEHLGRAGELTPVAADGGPSSSSSATNLLVLGSPSRLTLGVGQCVHFPWPSHFRYQVTDSEEARNKALAMCRAEYESGLEERRQMSRTAVRW